MIFARHRSRVHDLAARRVPKADGWADQLQQVFVGGNDDHRLVGAGQSVDGGGDQIVGLKTLLFQGGNLISGDDLFDIGDLTGQIIRHWRPISLVGRIKFMTEIFAAGVEGHRQEAGIFFPNHPQQGGGKAVNRMGGQAGGIA